MLSFLNNYSEPNHFFPGVYIFPFTFMNQNKVIGVCDVQLHINEGLSANTPYLVTAIVISSERPAPALQQCIEEVCTKIRHNFFDHLLSEDLSKNILLKEERIRWFEVLPYNDNGPWSEVKMKWDKKGKFYYSPEWIDSKPLLSLDTIGQVLR